METALLIAVALAAGLFAGDMALRLWSGRIGHDFTYYYAAAEVGRTFGWSHLYDLHLQRIEFARLTGEQFAPFVNPPPVAWLAAPFTLLTFGVAVRIWTVLLFSLLIAVALLAGRRRRGVSVAIVLTTFAVYPALWPARDGQIVALVAAAWVIAAWCLRSDREVLAGTVLAAFALKPQTALLAPVALLALARWRALAACLSLTAVLAALSAAALGRAGVEQYAAALTFAGHLTQQRELSLAWLLGDHAAPALEALLLAFAATAVWAVRRSGVDAVLAVAAVGSLLVSPYLNDPDLGLLIVPFWLLWPAGTLIQRLSSLATLVGMAVAWQRPYLLEVLFILLTWAAAVAWWRSPASGPTPAPSGGG